MNIWIVICTSAFYLLLLFMIAYLVERNHDSKLIKSSQGWIYALSLGVFCTSWALYGCVGRAAHTGGVFLSTYIGPVLVFVFASTVLRKILLIGKAQRTTSIADFISSRYGKSQAVAAMVTIFAMVGIMPYIALQLKSISSTFNLLVASPASPLATRTLAFHSDSAFYIALLLALFVVIFGARRVDATEQHRAMVATIAFESLTKLLALLAVGAFITYGLFGGFGDLYQRAVADPELAKLLDLPGVMSQTSFWAEAVLSAAAIICLPRQFQVTFIEPPDESHLGRARWVLPLYLVAMSVFVLPIAVAGRLTFSGTGVSPDSFLLALPLNAHSPGIALLAFIAGLSASTGMIIVEAIALSTMICNDLVMPTLLRIGIVDPAGGKSIAALVKGVRRGAILVLVLLGYAYAKMIGNSVALVSIGLLSFVAAAQFAPAILLGIYWKGGNRKGALAGLGCGFAFWLYTLFLPSIALSGWLPAEMLNPARIGLDWYHPYALFGFASDKITHGLFWSLLANVLAYVAVSLTTRQSLIESRQAIAFVDIFKDQTAPLKRTWSADVRVADLLALLKRFVDNEKASERFAAHEAGSRNKPDLRRRVCLDDVEFVENEISAVVGAASARIVIASVLKETQADILADALHVIESQWQSLRNAMENINQGISMYDSDLRLQVWNRHFLEMLGFPDRLGVVGTPFEDLIRYNAERGEYGPGDPEVHVERIVARAKRMREHKFERILPDGRVLEIEGKPLASGGFISTFTDITERKQQELALTASNSELNGTLEILRTTQKELVDQAKLASLGGLVAGVAHQLNTPIGNCLMIASVVQQQTRQLQKQMEGPFNGAALKNYINDIDNAADFVSRNLTRAAELVTVFKQVAVDQSSFKRSKFMLDEVFAEINMALRPLMANHPCKIVKDIPEGIKMDSYPAPLGQVLVDLIANAVIHAFVDSNNGTVTINARQVEENVVELTIADDGVGIAAETLLRIFDPFYTTKIGQGRIGLGLNIAHSIITGILGGKISVKSEVGDGTLFVLRIPNVAPELRIGKTEAMSGSSIVAGSP